MLVNLSPYALKVGPFQHGMAFYGNTFVVGAYYLYIKLVIVYR